MTVKSITGMSIKVYYIQFVTVIMDLSEGSDFPACRAIRRQMPYVRIVLGAPNSALSLLCPGHHLGKSAAEHGGRMNRVFGHFGQLLQGRFGPSGPVALVTLPCPGLWAEADVAPSGQMALYQPVKVVGLAGLHRVLRRLGLPVRGRFRLRVNMPPGGGAGGLDRRPDCIGANGATGGGGASRWWQGCHRTDAGGLCRRARL